MAGALLGKNLIGLKLLTMATTGTSTLMDIITLLSGSDSNGNSLTEIELSAIHDNNGFTHIKDDMGKTIIEIHPSDRVTPFEHIHIYDELERPLTIDGIVGDRKSPDVHIPLIKDR